jgi:hypothetical protein
MGQFREHASGNMHQVTCTRDHASGNIYQGIYIREHASGNIEENARNMQHTCSEQHAGKNEETFKEHAESDAGSIEKIL